MEKQVLFTEPQYDGNYVAMEDFDNPSVVAFGSNPQKVMADAEEQGFKTPVLVYVPAKDMVNIY